MDAERQKLMDAYLEATRAWADVTRAWAEADHALNEARRAQGEAYCKCSITSIFNLTAEVRYSVLTYNRFRNPTGSDHKGNFNISSRVDWVSDLTLEERRTCTATHEF